ncbi:MAG: thioredoxin [Fibrobacterota bacterium]
MNRIILTAAVVSLLAACSKEQSSRSDQSETESGKKSPVVTSADTSSAPVDENAADSVVEVTGQSGLDEIMAASESKIAVLDLYADWCQPCKILAPILEDLAGSESGKASFYKMNVDQNREIAQKFGVRGIPYVVFVKNGKVVHSLTGVQSKSAYRETIERFAGKKK